MANIRSAHAGTPIQLEEVRNILVGCDCDGGAMPTIPSYPRTSPSLEALHLNAHVISTLALGQNHDCLSMNAQRTTLVRRLAAYLVATGRFDEAIASSDAAHLAREIAAQPDGLNRCGIGGMLRHAVQKPPRTCEVTALFPEPLVYAEGPFELYELTHPNHLTSEGQRAGNCLGTSFDEQAARKAGASPQDIRYLTYWRRIAKRQLRLFSLRTRTSKILVTFALSAGKREITEIQYVSVHRYRFLMSFIARALFRSGIRLDSFAPPFYLKGAAVLLRTGEWTPYSMSLDQEIIGGNIDVPPDMGAEAIRRLVTATGLHLNFDASNDHQMPLITGPLRCRSIYSFSTVWPEGVTAVPTYVYFECVREARFTSLVSIDGMLSLNDLTDAHFPALKTIKGLLDAFDLANYSFPELRSITGGLSLADYQPAALPWIDVEELKLHQQLRDFEMAWDAC